MVNKILYQNERKQKGLNGQQDNINAALADFLKESENQKLTTQEYFKDLEKTGKYPKELQELIESGDVYKIPDYLESLGVDIVPSKDATLPLLPINKMQEMLKLSHNYFHSSEWIADYSGEGGPECSDGSDLYTLVRFNGKICLVKLAYGEFNRKTFIDGGRLKTRFNKSPFPLFVVSQHDSYFADKGSLPAEIGNIDARLYLDLYTVIASLKEGTAEKYHSWEYEDEVKTKFDWSQIKIPEYEELKSVLSKAD